MSTTVTPPTATRTDPQGPRTRAVHAGRADLAELGLHAPPLDLSSTYPLPDVGTGGESYESIATGGRPTDGGHVYARLWNPTVARFEEALAGLEGTQESVAFATGMAALSARCSPACRPAGRTSWRCGRCTAAATTCWRPARSGRRSPGRRPTRSPRRSAPTPAWSCASRRPTPPCSCVDIADVVRQAGDVPVLVDTRSRRRCCNSRRRAEPPWCCTAPRSSSAGTATWWAASWRAIPRGPGGCARIRAITGALLHPLSAYLLLRGLPTLPLRVLAQQETASAVAAHLSDHPAVTAVHHPSLAEADPRGLLGRQQSGPGSCWPSRCAAARQRRRRWRRGAADHPRRLARRRRLADPAPGVPDPPAGGGCRRAGRRPAAAVVRPRGRRRLIADLDQALLA